MHLVELPKIHVLLRTHSLQQVMERQGVPTHIVPSGVILILSLLTLKIALGHLVLVLLGAGIEGVRLVLPLRAFTVDFEGALFACFEGRVLTEVLSVSRTGKV